MELAAKILAEFWNVLTEMSPYLLFGFAVAGLLSAFISPALVERHLGGRGVWPVVKAAAFGVPLPLCSCGVIPVSASLRKNGASRGATTAFLISTPQTGVDSILVTLSLLGPVFAVFRPVAAFISGIAGGILVDVTDKPEGDPVGRATPAGEASCNPEPPRGALRKLGAGMKYGFMTLPGDIARSLVVGLVVAALISAVVPKDYFASSIGPTLGHVGTIVLMMLIGIPVYVCATASVPIALAMIHMGISPGAAFAFLVTGPATNAATIATMWKVMGPRATGLYLLTMAASAFGGGMLLDRLVTAGEAQCHAHEMHWMLPPAVSAAFAAAMLAVLAYALAGPHLRRIVGGDGKFREVEMKTTGEITLQISGMSCSHCATSVQRALLGCPGVQQADVNAAQGLACVRGQGMDAAKMRQAVESLGFTVAAVSEKNAGASKASG